VSRSYLNWVVRRLQAQGPDAWDLLAEHLWFLFTELTVEEFLSVVLTVADDAEHYQDMMIDMIAGDS